MWCRLSRFIGTCDNEQSIVFAGARYKHVTIHEEYDPTYIPPGPPRGTALGWSKRRVLLCIISDYSFQRIISFTTKFLDITDGSKGGVYAPIPRLYQ